MLREPVLALLKINVIECFYCSSLGIAKKLFSSFQEDVIEMRTKLLLDSVVIHDKKRRLHAGLTSKVKPN
jgi:hypothetical protein